MDLVAYINSNKETKKDLHTESCKRREIPGYFNELKKYSYSHKYVLVAIRLFLTGFGQSHSFKITLPADNNGITHLTGIKQTKDL